MRKAFHWLLFAMFASVLVTCGSPRPRPSAAQSPALSLSDPQESARVLAEIQQYYQDFSARDWPAFASHFWPQASISTVFPPAPGGSLQLMVMSIPEFVAEAPRGPGKKPIFEERMLAHEVRVFGDLAHVWATYQARFGDEKEVESWAGIDAFTLLRHRGSWKIVSLSFSAE